MKKDRGFVSFLFVLIIALALLKYFFNWSIFDAAASDQGRATIGYIRDILNLTWTYLAIPLTYFWYEVLVPGLDLLKR